MADPIRRVTPAERLAYTRALAKTPGAKWRFQTGDTFAVATRGASREGARFDEVVVDDWLHAEMMDTRSCFISVGPISIWLQLTKDGARVTDVELRCEDKAQRSELVKLLKGAIGVR